jgi:hypothetical protein
MAIVTGQGIVPIVAAVAMLNDGIASIKSTIV